VGRCSLRSVAANEPLAGTASRIRHWLLIEHGGPWGRDGLLDARLAEGVGAGLRALEARSGARVLLIRQPLRTGRDEGVVCVAIDTRDAWIGASRIRRVRDALDLDPRDRSAFGSTDEPLFVVCTHGRRDPCCAERGRPLARATALAAPTLVWESTHVGGDRFAANLVAFPHGLYFGRVEPEEGPEIVDAYRDGRIAHLRRYRGRTIHPTPVQAAEAALRQQRGLGRVDDVALERVRHNGDRVEVSFVTPAGTVVVTVERSIQPAMRLTCHSGQELVAPVWRPIDDGRR
jgi:hypothetical protein